jgi:hypothetical protein
MCDVEIMQSFMLPDGKVTKLSQNVSYTDIFFGGHQIYVRIGKAARFSTMGRYT